MYHCVSNSKSYIFDAQTEVEINKKDSQIIRFYIKPKTPALFILPTLFNCSDNGILKNTIIVVPKEILQYKNKVCKDYE